MKQNGPEDDFDNWLAQELRTRQPYLEDDGFGGRVMRALPASPTTSRLRPLVWSLLLALVTVPVTL